MKTTVVSLQKVTSLVTFPALLLAFGVLYPFQAVGQMRIRDNATGGDCQAQNIGVWNRPTCTLTRDFTGSIEIMNNKIILDGNDKTITGDAAHTIGVKIDGRQKVVVKKLKLTGFEKGILILGGEKNDVLGNSITKTTKRLAGCGICLHRTNWNLVADNVVFDNKSSGIELFITNNNYIDANVLSKNGFAGIRATTADLNVINDNAISGAANILSHGIQFKNCHNNMIWYNEIKEHRWDGIWFHGSNLNEVAFNEIVNNEDEGVDIDPGQKNRVFCNDISRDGGVAVEIGGGAGNKVYFNNILRTASARDNVPGPVNSFGGNYWQVNAPNCVDAKGDGFCDAPYVFPGNQDKLPRANQIPWWLRPDICDDPPAGTLPTAVPLPTELSSILDVDDEWFSAYDAMELDVILDLLADRAAFESSNGAALVDQESIRTDDDEFDPAAETPTSFELDESGAFRTLTQGPSAVK